MRAREPTLHLAIQARNRVHSRSRTGCLSQKPGIRPESRGADSLLLCSAGPGMTTDCAKPAAGVDVNRPLRIAAAGSQLGAFLATYSR